MPELLQDSKFVQKLRCNDYDLLSNAAIECYNRPKLPLIFLADSHCILCDYNLILRQRVNNFCLSRGRRYVDCNWASLVLRLIRGDYFICQLLWSPKKRPSCSQNGMPLSEGSIVLCTQFYRKFSNFFNINSKW